ncbi:MAG: 50S ribosomal protein L24 [Candidatus Gracilibacteria bacterium]|jgi:large subunit ribosomal protein L24
MKIKVNDKVAILAGKDKGKKGTVVRVFSKQNKVVVEKINIKVKHVKKTAQKAGEKIHFEAPIDASKVMMVCPSCEKLTRVGYKILQSGKKERICKKCKESVDRKTKTKK